ncbi:Arg80p [Saccharomyces cerevisiae x Saccharomyces kudriavzevii VIN7]|uniref:Arg80p n=1 Tax=Saccharomyces cerevisiae x Saccharomyces kudriavzevii (strain VIN7) TaxID=1095631 RepID=H0GZ88_SACCK|nr:Arg80p [Saccharomyces cerevisiae x Saccharomyces kudriavzevii VIN7]
MTSNSDGSGTSLVEDSIAGDLETNDPSESVRRLSTPLLEQDQEDDEDDGDVEEDDEDDGDVEEDDDNDKFSVGTSTPTPTTAKAKKNRWHKHKYDYQAEAADQVHRNKTRRHVTFSKRRHGIMKKAYELSVLTGANILLLILANSGLVYTFTTPKLEPVVREDEGKNLIKACINAPNSPDPLQAHDQPSTS